MKLVSEAQRETAWSYYEQTTMYFDLADRSGQPVPILAGAGEDDPPLGALHVVTAIQPNTDPSAIDNVNRMKVLDHELGLAGLQFLRAVGTSADGNTRRKVVRCLV